MDITIIYNIASLSLALLIVFFSAVTVRFGIEYLLITKMKKHFDWLVLLQTLIGLAWVLIFGYIAHGTIFNTTPIQAFSFGSLFIRPVILISSLTVSIWMYIRYKFEKTGRSAQWNLQEK